MDRHDLVHPSEIDDHQPSMPGPAGRLHSPRHAGTASPGNQRYAVFNRPGEDRLNFLLIVWVENRVRDFREDLPSNANQVVIALTIGMRKLFLL